jgi:uncharacterized protein (TIGR02444 family)
MVSSLNDLEPPARDFWRFSIAFYGRPGVAAACLDLQDRHGADVNLVLFACWVGIAGRGRLSAAALAQAENAAKPWREAVIAPLRAVRKYLKNDSQEIEFYKISKEIELKAEHVAQDRLEALAPPIRPADAATRRLDALANLAAYLGTDARFAASEPIRAALDGMA